jgi:Domain of unknown function (DUF4363)
MKNIIASYILFSLIIILLICGVLYLNKTASRLMSESNELEELIKKESWEKAYDSSVSILNQWEKASHTLSIVIDHQKLDNINIEVLKLSQFTKCSSKEESLASIHTIKFLLEHLMNLEKISVQNIL